MLTLFDKMETQNNTWTSRSRKNTRHLAYWTLAWVLTMAIATFGPISLWPGNQFLTLIAFVINLGAGIGMIFANIRHLRGLDELQQRIQLNAMGIALSVGVVGGLSYSMLDTTNLIAGDAEISVLVIAVSLTYLAAVIIGNRMYQ
jgi:hypothetical protein